jgi:ABC-type antimicrobial peptide transport system permease subunit
LIAAFGLAALVLSAMGVFAVLASSVSQRTHELGVRAALGAAPRDLFRLVVGEGVAAALAGGLLGLLGALAATRLLASLLFEVSPADPLVLSGAVALLIGVAAAASWLPALRASRADPLISLRQE